MRFPRPHQCRNRGVLGADGKLYCKIHDPVAIKAKKDKKNAKFEAEMLANDAIREKAASLSESLEVDGKAEYSPFCNRVVKNLVISFSDAEKLIARIRALEAK